MENADVRVVRDEIAVMTWRNMLVGVWTAQPTESAAIELRAQYKAMSGQCPSGFVAGIIVEDGVPAPDDDVRRAIADTMREVRSSLLGMCGVQESTGFRGAAIRSVITAMVLMSQAPYKTKTVATVREAADWMAPFVKPNASPAQIADTIRHFRASVNVTRVRKTLAG